MQYKAIGDSVIVEIPLVEKGSQRESGLFIIQDDPTNESPITATVLSIGEGRVDPKTGTLLTPPVKVGDRVVINMQTGIKLDDTRKMIKVDDIFALVTE